MATADERYPIEKRTPGIDNYMRLRQTAGLTPFSRAAAEIGLKGTVFAVVVVVDGQVVRMGRLIGNGGYFFQVTDIAVQPDH